MQQTIWTINIFFLPATLCNRDFARLKNQENSTINLHSTKSYSTPHWFTIKITLTRIYYPELQPESREATELNLPLVNLSLSLSLLSEGSCQFQIETFPRTVSIFLPHWEALNRTYVRTCTRTNTSSPRLLQRRWSEKRSLGSGKVRHCTTLRRSPCIPFRINYRHTYMVSVRAQRRPLCASAHSLPSSEGTCRRRRRRRHRRRRPSATSRARPTRRKLASVTNVTRTRMEKLRIVYPLFVDKFYNAKNLMNDGDWTGKYS